MIQTLAIVLILMLAVMSAAWLTVRATNNGGWIDVFWTFGTGLAGVVAALCPWAGPPSARQVLVACLVALWSLRLGSYIALRVAKGAEDVRYATLKKEWGADFLRKLFGMAIVQAPATTLLCASIAAAALRPGEGLIATDFAGAAILLIAIAGEGLADAQMKAFKADPANHGKVMDKGLWGWSRHPNYFFEWFGWLAYPVIAIDPGAGWPPGWAATIAPVAMYLILTRLTGVPPLEAAMTASRGQAYRDYQARVGAFFLAPPKSQPRSPA
jgi:steroid 5-alpha reductase family enzyme